MPAVSASVTSCQSPSSIRISTLSMPRCWAQAVPPIILPAPSVPSDFGTSILLWVSTGASVAHSRSVQYAVRSA